jgi:hypothetical protein
LVGTSDVAVSVADGIGVSVSKTGVDVFVSSAISVVVELGTAVLVWDGICVKVAVGCLVGVFGGRGVLVHVGGTVEVGIDCGRRVLVGFSGLGDTATTGVWDRKTVGAGYVAVIVGVGTYSINACSVSAPMVARLAMATSIKFNGSTVTCNAR